MMRILPLATMTRATVRRTMTFCSFQQPLSSRHFAAASFIQEPRTVSVVGAPIALGQPKHGVDMGPDVMRKGGLLEHIMLGGWGVHDLGDIHQEQPIDSRAIDHPNAKNSNRVGAANKALRDICEAEARKGNFVLTLGGDHSLAIGSISGILAARPETGIVWVDAHADINTHRTSASGNIHGMSVAFLMRYGGVLKVPGFEWLRDRTNPIPPLDPSRLVYIGLRDVDEPERDTIHELGIKAFTMVDIDRWGIGEIMEKAKQHLSNCDSLHLSLDIDAVDPVFAPATGTKVRGGLTFREAHYICEMLAEGGQLGSMDLVEVNPTLSSEKIAKVIAPHAHVSADAKGPDPTVDMAIGLIQSALGDRIL